LSLLTDPTFGPFLIHRIIAELETRIAHVTVNDAMDTDVDSPSPSPSLASEPRACLVVHFHAVDFSNVAAGMKALVVGFLDKAREKGLQRGMLVFLVFFEKKFLDVEIV
jgi:hypothetical protein